MVYEVNGMVPGRRLELVGVGAEWFEMNQLLFPDDTALVVIQIKCVD